MSDIYRQFDESHECYMSDQYALHVSRMTEEGLHSKSDIALELAYRDIEIKRLEGENKDYFNQNEDLLCQLEDAQLSQSPWVSVAERLPEEYGSYLVLLHRKYKRLHSYTPHGAGWYASSTLNRDITHWMPIPALPETTDLLDNAIGGVPEFPSIRSKENV